MEKTRREQFMERTFGRAYRQLSKLDKKFFDKMDEYRKKRHSGVSVKDRTWKAFSIHVRNNFVGMFSIYLIFKYKEHHHAINMRPFDLITTDDGVHFRFKHPDCGKGWFDNSI